MAMKIFTWARFGNGTVAVVRSYTTWSILKIYASAPKPSTAI